MDGLLYDPGKGDTPKLMFPDNIQLGDSLVTDLPGKSVTSVNVSRTLKIENSEGINLEEFSARDDAIFFLSLQQNFYRPDQVRCRLRRRPFLSRVLRTIHSESRRC